MAALTLIQVRLALLVLAYRMRFIKTENWVIKGLPMLLSLLSTRGLCVLLLSIMSPPAYLLAQEASTNVNVLNYVHAKTALHFDRVAKRSGGVNKWSHVRVPIPLDQQRSRRMNRDTLYSSSIINISQGATLTMPDSGQRYMSAAVINEDHYINKIFHGAGKHTLNLDEFDSPFVLLIVRILVNADDAQDIEVANQLQDSLVIQSASSAAYSQPNYDRASLDAVTKPLIELAASLPDVIHTFGTEKQVNKVRHLLATAYGFGGLPESETFYLNVQPKLPVGAYSLTVKDVPVDGFWSISVYNQDGFFEANKYDVYSINNLSAKASADGSYTINFGGNPLYDNFIPIAEGWNYVVRMYRPRESIVNGTWTFPEIPTSK
jgi:hypothetical protein